MNYMNKLVRILEPKKIKYKKSKNKMFSNNLAIFLSCLALVSIIGNLKTKYLVNITVFSFYVKTVKTWYNRNSFKIIIPPQHQY